MADAYWNIGAPIRRDGQVVAKRGDIFEPTEKELKTLAYKLRPVVTPVRGRVTRAELEASQSTTAGRKKPDLPKMTELPGVLAGMTDPGAIRDMAEADSRSSAAKLYAARLGELNG